MKFTLLFRRRKLIVARVWDIGPNAHSDELRALLEKEIPGSNPVVWPFLLDPDNGTKSALVALSVSSKKAGHRAIHGMRSRRTQLRDETGHRSDFGIDSECQHITIAARTDENPTFDVCFIHGLGGHALKTFSSKVKDPRELTVWPCDLLPGLLDTQQHRGRYMTFGYEAGVFNSDVIPSQIIETARVLLDDLIVARGPDCQRPLFFICHSLGGLVACQAALLTQRDLHVSNHMNRFQQAFNASHASLIQGIVFFGTPFKGSKLAYYGSLLSKRLFLTRLINDTTLNYLSVKNKDVKDLMQGFRRWAEVNSVALLNFHERKRLSLGPLKKLIVSRASSEGIFDENVVPNMPIRADHVRMVKFDGPNDPIWHSEVQPHLKTLIQNRLDKLEELSRIQSLAWSQLEGLDQTAFHSGTRGGYGALVDRAVEKATVGGMSHQPDSNAFPLNTPQMFDGGSASTAEHADILFQDLAREANKLEIPPDKSMGGTCDWLISHPRYLQWLENAENDVLFFEAPAGYGKSYLSRFLVHHLFSTALNNPETSTASVEPGKRILCHSMSSKREKQRDLDSILKDILLSLMRYDSDMVESVWHQIASPSILALHRVQMYWIWLNECRKHLNVDLFCIIDGLDECLGPTHGRPTDGINTMMVDFLRGFCTTLDEKRTSTSAQTKICIFTRPTKEVQAATQGREIRYTIRKIDIEPALKLYVKSHIDTLSRSLRRDFPQRNQEAMMEAVINKCSPNFLMTRLLIERLSIHTFCDLGSEADIQRRVREFHHEDFDKLYLGFLDQIPRRNYDKVAKLIRILYFSYAHLSVNGLRHALAIPLREEDDDKFTAETSSGSMDFFRSGGCGPLLDVESGIETDDEDTTISFAHQSIYEFFGRLSNRRYAAFSCSQEQEGHFFMALLCVRCLTLRIADDNLLLGTERNFIVYAARYWTWHAQEAGPIISGHLHLFKRFLGVPSPSTRYSWMLRVNQLWNAYESKDDHDDFNDVVEDLDFVGMAPDDFIASHDLRYLLPIYYQPSRRSKLSNLITRRFFRMRELKGKLKDEINAQGHTGRTILHHAVEAGATDSVDYLLRCGASGFVFDNENETPFSLAIDNEHDDILLSLVRSRDVMVRGPNKQNMTCLHMACAKSMELAVVVSGLIVNINATTIGGWTPLHVAAQKDNPWIVHYLLCQGANPDARKSSGLTPLYLAASAGHINNVKTLFAFRPALDPVPKTESWGQTPLYAAASGGHIEVFDYLFEKNPDVDPDVEGWLPIHIASINGHESIVRRLKDSITLRSLTTSGRNALHLAAEGGHLPLVKFLVLECGMDPSLPCPDHYQPSKFVEQSNTGRPDAFLSPFALAVRTGHDHVAEFLLTQNVSTREGFGVEGWDALHYAVATGRLGLFDKLVVKGHDPMSIDKYSRTPFHHAASHGNLGVCQWYFKEDVPMRVRETFHVDMKDSSGQTALCVAAEANHQAIFDFLLEQSASINTIDMYGQTLVHQAVESENPALLKICVAKGLECGTANLLGETPLHFAARHGDLTNVRFLLNQLVAFDPESLCGETPLLIAAKRGHTRIVKQLLAHGADPIKARDLAGRNALDIMMPQTSFGKITKSLAARYTPFPDILRDIWIRKSAVRLHRQWTMMSDNAIKGLLLNYISFCFKEAGKLRAVAIFAEHRLFRSSAGRWIYSGHKCDVCKSNSCTAPVSTCAVCPDVDYCSICRNKLDEEVAPGCDSNHEMIVIGGQEYMTLPIGYVDQEGHNFESWLDAQIADISAELENLERKLASNGNASELLSPSRLQPSRTDSFVRLNVWEAAKTTPPSEVIEETLRSIPSTVIEGASLQIPDVPAEVGDAAPAKVARSQTWTTIVPAGIKVAHTWPLEKRSAAFGVAMDTSIFDFNGHSAADKPIKAGANQ